MSVQPSDKITLQDAIDQLFLDLSNMSPDSEEFATAMKSMDTLYRLKEVDHKIKTSRWLAPEILAPIAANLLGIAMIVGHERAHVVTSKALSLITKLR